MLHPGAVHLDVALHDLSGDDQARLNGARGVVVRFPGETSRRPDGLPDFASITPTKAATWRLFFVTKKAGDNIYACSSPLAPRALEHVGNWWESPEAERARAGLDVELAKCTAPQPVWGEVQDLVHFVPCGASTSQWRADGFRAGTVLRRRTAFSTGAPPSPPRNEWRELDTTQKPSAVLMTHAFSDTPVPGATLTLRTLFLEDVVFEVKPEEMFQEVFGGRKPALSGATLRCSTNLHFAPTTDVEIDGEALTEAQLAALPKRARRAVEAARSLQLLSTLHECLGTARWVGGFLALRHLAEDLTGGSARLWTEPLAVDLLRARTGGLPSFPLVQSLELWAGAHLQAQDYHAAQPLLRAVCDAHQ